MSANLSDRRSLIAQLAWQEAMGIDEVLLDRHDDDRSLSISDLIPAQAPAQAPSQQTSHPSRPV
ncbi:MAG TPA: hypothetical protein DGU02_07195, partial [Alphaproteobacteria bacterium]|nr:hypothetical protein [Alphaproteobacteria bacterium]